MFAKEKRQLRQLGGSAKKKKGGCRAGGSTATVKAESKKKGVCCAGEPARTTATATATAESNIKGGSTSTGTGECKFMGGDYLMGFKPDPTYDYATDTTLGLIPYGALPEDRPHFNDIWFRYERQLQTTNGMELDTYPGPSMLADTVPIRWSHTTQEERVLILELVNLAVEIYNNDDSNVFKYKLLKIEKVNARLTGYIEYFMTVKLLNVTLATVVETFQIYAGRRMGGGTNEAFSCVPKGGALM